MGKLIMSLVGASLFAAPTQVNAQPADIRPGAFAGVRFQLSLGGQTGARPRAALAISPTHTRIFGDGTVETRIGEGVALNLTAGAKPTLTIAGVTANSRLRFQRNGEVNSSDQIGVSETGWVAIGVGVAAAAAAVGFVLVLDEAKDNSD